MQYWIDGYNLLFRTGFGKGSLEQRRRALIVRLDTFAQTYALSLSLFFDAEDEQREHDRTAHYNSLKIVYTTSQVSADESIIARLEEKKKRSTICVVSSDRALIARVRALGAEGISLSDFFGRLEKKRLARRNDLSDCADSPREIRRLQILFEKRLQEEEN